MKVLITAIHEKYLPPHEEIMEVPEDTASFLKLFASQDWGRFSITEPGKRPGQHPELFTLHFENDYD